MPEMTDLAFVSARKQASLIRKREIGCLEMLDYMIARVERLDPKLNAVVVRDFDRARAKAKLLDKVKDPLGRLHGVPMTVKESFDIAGLPTTWGSPDKKNDVAAHDAVLVHRLGEAGANIFGKTNVPLMLGDWQSFNAVYGSTGNPWDLERTPGGSSGGGAAALAAGLTGLESGSDIGGSIRQPAHACGLFGHKPTWSLVPLYGHAPMPGVAGTTDISCVGPLARSAEDLSGNGTHVGSACATRQTHQRT
jgi:amidase